MVATCSTPRLCLSGALAIVLATALALGACTPSAGVPGSPAGPAEPDAVRVVATSTVLADLVRSVGGDRVSVTSLVPKGGEVHTYDPSPQDLAHLREADLVVMNGLGLDEWLSDQVAQSGSQATVIELG